jgi:CRP/FNR family putative post-exponential-phase nitrogen-starvation transcriptional regulator
MEKIFNTKILNKYIEKHSVNEFFNKDMRPFMELLLYKRNEHICRENEKINYLFFFVEGKAKIYTTLSNGKSLLLCFYYPLKILGDVELINTKAATTNVQVLIDTYCIGIPMEKVREHLLDDATFLRCTCDALGKKLERISKNSSINLLYPLENRLAGYILAAGENVNNYGEKVIEFNENLTEISELLGTSYRHLLRTLNTLCSKGILIKKNTCYEVIDEVILKNLAADLYK